MSYRDVNDIYYKNRVRQAKIIKDRFALLKACKEAVKYLGDYYDQESFDEEPLFKATEILKSAITEVESIND